MQATNGGITYSDIYGKSNKPMPAARFYAFVKAIERINNKEKDQQYFNNQNLQQEWEENKDEWLKRQPPPEKR